MPRRKTTETDALSTRQLSPNKAKASILHALKIKRPIFVWGGPGIGKSEVIHQIAKNIDAHVIDIRLSLWEPTDIKGIPYFNSKENNMVWAQPSELPTSAEAKKHKNIVLFLDEMNSAAPSVQAAAYQLVLNKRVGQYNLPSNVRIIAAGNRETDRGVTYRMPAPLANRFRHVNLGVDFGDWQTWAMNNEVHPDVIGYLSYAKQDLFDFDPKTSSQSFATPRSWSIVSSMLKVAGFNDADAFEQKAEIAGAVGEGMAAKFVEHRRIANTMPNPQDIMDGKVKKLDKKLGSEISAKYSLVVSLTYEINEIYKESGVKGEFKEKFNNTVRFAYDNFDPEMVVLLFKTIMSDYKIKFNIRTDLDKDVYKVFAERYTKYIV